MSIPGAASPLFLAATAAGPAGDFEISRSLRFSSGDSAYLSRTPSSAGNRKTWTWSGWVKRSALGSQKLFVAGASGTEGGIQFYSGTDNTGIEVYDYSSSYITQLDTSQLFRDVSAWYHIVLAYDTTQSTAANRVKLYINGLQVTDFATETYPSQNYEGHVNNNIAHTIGAISNPSGFLNGYLAEVNFIDGSALDATSFGAFDDNGVWQAIDTSGLTFGTNGFRLKFADNSGATATTLGKDTSGNSNNWTPSNLSVSGGPLNKTRGHNYDDTAATYTDLGTVSQATPGSAPTGNSGHYEGAAMRVNSGGAKVVTTNSAAADFFMACWVRLDSLVSGHQIGVDLSDNYKYFEVRSDGKVKVRHKSGGANTSGSSHLSNNTWQHIALSRSGNTLTGFVNGSAVVNTDCGNVTYSVSANDDFFFFGIGTSTTGYLVDAVIYIGEGRTTNFTAPSAPLLTSTAGINNVGGMSTSNRYYASSLIAVGAGNEGIDSLVDSPSNGTASTGGDPGGSIVGNYATLNPLNLHSDITLSNGNLELTKTNNAYRTAVSTIGVSSGKWYFEVKPTANVDGTMYIGIEQIVRIDKQIAYQNGNNGFAWRAEGGFIQNDAMGSGSSYGSAGYTNNDVIGVAADLDNGSLTFYKNGTSQGAATIFNGGTLPSGTYFFGVSPYASGATVQVNFGQRAFAYAAPSGYKSLNTANLPTPTIADGSKYFDTKLYTGDGNSSNAQSGLKFSPNFLWFKGRSAAYSHALFDTIRGVTKRLKSDDAEGESTSSTWLISFNSDGFTVGSDGTTNANNQTYAAWAWDAGTGSPVTNNDGSIASQVRAQPSAGFSIVSYTNGDGTVGHGLSAPPELIISKRLDATYTWGVYSKPTTKDKYLALNSTAAAGSYSNIWGSAEPTSSVFGTSTAIAPNNSSMIAYCFAPVAGYSAIGSYTGTGSTDGVFVHTGFKIAWLLIKRTDATKSWQLIDNARSTFNVTDDRLFPDDYGVESDGSNFNLDFLSNGFKCRTAHNSTNESGATYLYLAFASNPFASNGGLAR